MKSIVRLLPLVLTGVLLGGCDEGREALPQTTVRVANAAPSFETIDYRRESTSATTLAFKAATEPFVYDADTYDFTIETWSLVQGETGQTHTWSQEIRADRVYTFVLTEEAGTLGHAVLEYAPLAAGATETQIVGFHAASGIPAMDVYVVPPGGTAAAGTPLATIAPQQSFLASSTAGDLEFWLTEAGNPANVLLATNALPLPAGVTTTFIIVPDADESTEPFSVLGIQAGSQVLYDRNATAKLRVINGAGDGQPRDFALNSEFNPPLFPAIPFATATEYVEVPVANAQPIAVTPVGNPGVLELNRTFATTAARYYTIFFAGPAGEFTYQALTDDRRAIQGEGKLRFLNAVSQFGPALVEFVLTSPGTDPATAPPAAVLSPTGASGVLSLPPGSFELSLRRSSQDGLVAGPLPITIESGGNYTVLATNGPDEATASIVLLDDFQ